MGRAHTEPNLLPAELAVGISSLIPQNIVISEPIPGWCSGDEAVHPSGEGWEWKRKCGASSSQKHPTQTWEELGRTPASPSPSHLLLRVHPWSSPKSHPVRDFPMEELNEERRNQAEHWRNRLFSRVRIPKQFGSS